MGIFWENIKIALLSLKLNKIRSLLTILGTTIGVFAVIMIIAIVTGLKDEIRSQIVSLGADVLDIIPGDIDQFGPGSEQIFATFKKSEVEEMRKHKDLYRNFSEMVTVSSTFEYQKERQTGFTIGIQPDYFAMGDRKSVAGTLFGKKEVRGSEKVAVVGINVANKLYGAPERTLSKEIKINGSDYLILGIMEPQDMKFGNFDIDDAVYIPATIALRHLENASLREVYLSVPDETKINFYKTEWESILAKIRPDEDYSVLGQEDLLQVVDRIMGLITTALAGIASISLLVGGIGIMNIMLVSVTERTKEIGIRKAVGAEDWHILLQFMTESVVLSLLGGLIGLLLVFLTSLVLQRFFNISSLITLPTIFGALIFSGIVGVLFGTAPAYKAAKKDPIDALRYNE